MKYLRCTIIAFILILLFLSCEQKKKIENISTLPLYSPEYSTGFRIDSIEGTHNTLITILDPWQGSKNEESRLLLNHKGEISNIPDAQVINGEAKRIVCMSSTHIAILEALGLSDKIVGVSGKEYVSNEKIRNNENIPDVGHDSNVNYEALVALKPDLVFLFSVNGASPMEKKLKELNIPFVYIGDYVEQTPLGKAEWLIPIAEIFGMRKEAIEQFTDIETKYDSLRNLVKDSELVRPKVMLNAPFGDSWFMPSTSSYVARLMEDAGVDYLYKKDTGNASLPIDMETALSMVSEADYWLNPGTFINLDDLIKAYPKFSKSDCVVNGKVFNNNKRLSPGGGNDYFESGAVQPYLILQDLITIFHPELTDNSDLVYYHQLK